MSSYGTSYLSPDSIKDLIKDYYSKSPKINDEVKSVENMEVLKLSICQKYNNLNTEMDKILSHIHRGDDLRNMNKMIEEYKRKLDYFPDEISLMNEVADRLYKNGKYYLD